jgi:tetratricopeptide (TPR) repeat protein
MNCSTTSSGEQRRLEAAHSRRWWADWAFALILPACTSAPSNEAQEFVSASAAALADDERPPGVEPCTTTQSQNHPAAIEFWRVFNGNDYAARANASELLKRATEDHPDDAYLALLHAHVNLWRLAEMQTFDDALVALGAVDTAEREFERSYALCPTDHRIPAWLGPLKVAAGRLFGDDARSEEGMRILEQGIAHYPRFVTFSKLLVFADVPIDTPEFKESLEAVRITRALCDGSADPSCTDTPRVPHNREGGAIYLGDVYARAQDREAALAMYMSAKSRPAWNTWQYQEVLEERIRSLDARMAAAATPSTLDDHPTAWAATNQCALCHRE